jgi:hypothetical protein
MISTVKSSRRCLTTSPMLERALVEGFAGAAVTLQHLNTQLALGQPIDLPSTHRR